MVAQHTADIDSNNETYIDVFIIELDTHPDPYSLGSVEGASRQWNLPRLVPIDMYRCSRWNFAYLGGLPDQTLSA
jgi:hypothetical protein